MREKISAIYWKAVAKLGSFVPTPQVIGATATGLLYALLTEHIPNLGVSEVSIGAIVTAVVAYLIGPERDPKGQRLQGAPVTDRDDVLISAPPQLRQVGGGDDKLPSVKGVWVGPDDPSEGKIV